MGDMSIRSPKGEGDERETPPELFTWASRNLGAFDLDVCATRENAKCPAYYDIEADGLTKMWHGNVWCNPPYSDIAAWVMRARTQMFQPAMCERIVMLVPSATETDWWRSMWSGATEIVFLSPRVRFLKNGEQMGSPPFGSALALFYPRVLFEGPRVGLARWK